MAKKEYWIAVQTATEELPTVWNCYADSAKIFARKLFSLPEIVGVAVGPEGRAHTWKLGNYRPED